ncbi:MAG: DNA topoisomerase IV subunit B [Alphaproteobacteria bacterium]|nr:DNA topoisomerase IV subunit B [Alphaproteobacteria bacterium]MCL2505729.1 DNA topoisomerase IV subunit B [Alphaproteobacteria bacterium]
MAALFDRYDARDIEVLEGLEPVRRRPGMYIGGTDETALHHLAAEVLDNSMDEAVAGYASFIEIELKPNNVVTIKDNGRGIPVDKHPKYPDKSALEVILTTLHSGGKFSDKVYETSGGLHGVGISVVNALSEELTVEVARDKQLYVQTFSRGLPITKLKKAGAVNRRGTSVTFKPDTEIFGSKIQFKPSLLFRMARSKACLFRGIEIRWSCAKELLKEGDTTPTEAVLHFPGGLEEYLQTMIKDMPALTDTPFAGIANFPDGKGKVEWAVAWLNSGEGSCSSYCNTVPTPQGGTHESGMRSALLRGLRTYGEMIGNKRINSLSGDEAFESAVVLLSVFIKNPQFQGQTKDRLSTVEVIRLVEQTVKDNFEHWLVSNSAASKNLLDVLIFRAEERMRAAQARELARKTATKKLRLPGKLADCSKTKTSDTEIFLVEGDSAGGSAKQARNRETQAILPLRGKILNVASASTDRLRANTEIQDLAQALGCGLGADFDLNKLRYDRVIIMTDADVDGAHIASLLMTFFYREMPELIKAGYVYLAQPPLFRLSHGNNVLYARDEDHRDELLQSAFKGKSKVEVSRFKGLGEMMPAQLKETTMNPKTRSLLRVVISTSSETSHEEIKETETLVEQLMGKKAELRFQFIQENARFAREVDV